MSKLAHLDQRLVIVIAVLPALALAAYLLLPLVRWLMNQIYARRQKRTAMARAAELRRTSPSPGPVRVRQTDIVANMSPQDRAKHVEATALAEAGKIREAAQIFEAIKFQRRAIDLLEQHGFIDDACAILLRLKVPNRVGAVYERNQMYAKAAHYFAVAELHPNAGHAYVKAARDNYRYLANAADHFTKGGLVEDRLKALAALMQADAVVEICFAEQRLAFLLDFMRDPLCARHVLARLDQEQLDALFETMVPHPSSIQLMVNWLCYAGRESLRRRVIRKIPDDVDLCRYFWALLPEGLRAPVIADMQAIKDELSESVRRRHDDIIKSLKRSA